MPRTASKTTRRRPSPAPPTLSGRLLGRVRELLAVAAPTDGGFARSEVRFLLVCERYLTRRLARTTP